MSGPIAFILAVMISTAVAVGDMDISGIIAEAERIEKESKEKTEAAKYLIAIDPGHQERGNFGQEPVGPGASETKTKVAGGTRGTSTGVPEYQLTLDVSLRLRDVLEDKGYRVLMIRETNDVDITNSERAKMANEADADVFVRVHANGSESSSANGAMTICQTSSNPYNSELYKKSRSLSQKVLDAYTEATGIRKERVWETDTMSGINWCTVPVTIIEVGYMTNPEEDEKMQDPDFQELMAEGIAEGIEDYLSEQKEDGGAETDEAAEASSEEETSVEASSEEASSEEEASDEEAPEEMMPETDLSKEGASEAASSETARPDEDEIEPAGDKEPESGGGKNVNERKITVYTAPASKTERSAKELEKIVTQTGDRVIRRSELERYVKAGVGMAKLKKRLNEEISKLGGKWSLYLKRMDTNQTIGINEDEKMVAASLIKLFIAGEFYTLAEEGELDADNFRSSPDLMISVSDNGAANSLISACTMDKINEFARENGYEETVLNRRMLEWNGTENYTSARDCGKMLEQVLKGEYVSEEASERILEDLRNQQRTSKIPAGVPKEVKTGNKTGELDNVDNDAAIIWAPGCTYILCIMSSDTGGRIAEIRKLSSIVYDAIGASED